MSVRAALPFEEIKKAAFVYRDIGMAMEHNYLCAVCRETPAVLEMWSGILQPCWGCQERGFKLIRKTWIDRILRR